MIHGTLKDDGKHEELSATHNIIIINIINCAAPFNVPLTGAILRGIRPTRVSTTPILLYLNGTEKFLGHSKFSVYILQERPFNDRDPDQVHNIDA